MKYQNKFWKNLREFDFKEDFFYKEDLKSNWICIWVKAKNLHVSALFQRGNFCKFFASTKFLCIFLLKMDFS